MKISFLVILYQFKGSIIYSLRILTFPKNVGLKTKASGVSEKVANTFVFCSCLCVDMRGETVFIRCPTDRDVSAVNC